MDILIGIFYLVTFRTTCSLCKIIFDKFSIYCVLNISSVNWIDDSCKYEKKSYIWIRMLSNFTSICAIYDGHQWPCAITYALNFCKEIEELEWYSNWGWLKERKNWTTTWIEYVLVVDCRKLIRDRDEHCRYSCS